MTDNPAADRLRVVMDSLTADSPLIPANRPDLLDEALATAERNARQEVWRYWDDLVTLLSAEKINHRQAIQTMTGWLDELSEASDD